MKASELINKFTIDPVKDIENSCDKILTKYVDVDKDFHCINCGYNTLISYPTDPWASVLYCPCCESINLVYHQDRMSGVHRDDVRCYK